MIAQDISKLIAKYNVPGPRYTSYPTVPYWEDMPTQEIWLAHLNAGVKQAHEDGSGVSLYIHIPFCKSLCSYCGCNTTITRSTTIGHEYVQWIHREWDLLLSHLEYPVALREVHLGGGTPNFLSALELRQLLRGISENPLDPTRGEYSFEADPRTLTLDQVQTIYDLGFRRISFGIQDFDPRVQKVVNRIQPVEMVKTCTSWARSTGYTSVNFDLIYGLPFQTEESIRKTFRAVTALRPDRVAFYSYAHVPWIKPSQRLYTDADLPVADVKRTLYELGRSLLEESGYLEVGMDHFSLPSDLLWKAYQGHFLNRNFMGYTTTQSKCLIGLGVSSISDSWTAFAQNHKTLGEYTHALSKGQLPLFRGHVLSPQDLILRKHILDLMCKFETELESSEREIWQRCLPRLAPFKQDGLVQVGSDWVQVTKTGKSFIRNICMAFDERMMLKKPDTQLFSQTV
jgi:oxygen-independent coproporphyrinogen-3 oxidase